MQGFKLAGWVAATAAALALPTATSAQDNAALVRCVKKTELANAPPTVKLLVRRLSSGVAYDLQVTARDPDGDMLRYSYSATGGRVTEGELPELATWSVAGLAPDDYTVTVEVDDTRGCVAAVSETVTVDG